jgi:hypothetical protein
VAVVDDEPGAGGALVDGRHVHLLPFPRHDPSPAGAREAGREIGSGGGREQRPASVKGGPEVASKKSVAVGSWTPEKRSEREFIGRAATGGSDWEGEGGGEVKMAVAPIHPARGLAVAAELGAGIFGGRDGIFGVPAKAGNFFSDTAGLWSARRIGLPRKRSSVRAVRCARRREEVGGADKPCSRDHGDYPKTIAGIMWPHGE